MKFTKMQGLGNDYIYMWTATKRKLWKTRKKRPFL